MKKLILVTLILLMGYATTKAKDPTVIWQDKPLRALVDYSYKGNFINFEKSRQIYLGTIIVSNALSAISAKMLKLEITFDVNKFRESFVSDSAGEDWFVDSTYWGWKPNPKAKYFKEGTKSKLTEMLLEQEAAHAVSVAAYLNAQSSFGIHTDKSTFPNACDGAVIVLHAGKDVCTIICDFAGGVNEYGYFIERYPSVESAIRYGFVIDSSCSWEK